MKSIKLLSLHIENFKGIPYKTFNFNGKSASIYGDNATGKSTVYDALTWLLFGKDSRGASTFEVKPLDQDGNVREAGIMPTVTAVLEVDSDTITLQKVLRERWERQRGSADKRLVGNTADYTVDEVPRKESEYKSIISQIIDENTFRQLTSVFYFCNDLPWKDRRARLFDLCSVQSDEQILATAPDRFTELHKEVGHRTVDEYKAVLRERRKKYNGTLNELPARIDECQKTVSDITGMDFSILHKQESKLTEQHNSLQAELLKLENNTLLAEKQTDRSRIENEIRKLDMDNTEFRRSQDIPVLDERPTVQAEIRRLKTLLADTQERREDYQGRVKILNEKVEGCRDEWNEIHNRPFADDVVCKACGQKLPVDQIADLKLSFEEQKRADKQEVTEKADRFKSDKESYEKRIPELDTEIQDYQKSVQDAEDRLKDMAEPKQPTIEDLPDYQRRRAELEKQLSSIETEISSLRGETSNIRRDTQERIAELDGKLREVRSKLAAEVTLQNARNRMEELRLQQKETAALIENMDRMIELCEDFVQYKVKNITETINSRFQFVKFRLFREQVNGGLEDCCDAMVDGVPYGSLNNAARINAGLDVIKALSEYANVKVPLFVDNAESVTRLYPLDTQVIRLIVSEDDKELRCEV